MPATSQPHPLTPEQQAIATAPAEQSQLVLAAPGTGKTHTVIARIRYLVEEVGLHPRQELLVLCFSRAAVREIMLRVTQLVKDWHVHDDLRFVTVRTFDSFATGLLLNADPGRDLHSIGYDGRIKMAVQALQSADSDETGLIAGVRHLIVDEIQDLVGVRAELVRQMIGRISGGFTLLGDPAQAIYGFSAQEAGSLTPDLLLRWLREQTWHPVLQSRELTKNHRSRGKMAQVSDSVRKELLAAGEKDTRPLERLREIVAGLTSSGSVLEPAENLDQLDGKTVCIACRTNGEVLQIGTMLARKGIRFHLRPRVEDSGLPAWIGRVLGTNTSNRLTQTAFEKRWQAQVTSDRQPDAELAWRWLKRVEGEDRRDLDVPMLHRRLAAGQRLPDEADGYLDQAEAGVSLSTIHAVKGREFDRVVVLAPGVDAVGDNGSPLEEARVLYVAATRAREELSRLDRTGLPRMWVGSFSSGQKRWIAHLRSYRMYLIEVGPGRDVDVASSVSTYVQENSTDAGMAQDYLWQVMTAGMDVAVRRTQRGKWTFYQILHERGRGESAVRLGQMSLPFLKDVRDAVTKYGRGRGRDPLVMSVKVAAVVTELLPPFPQNVHEPYASSGFCLGVRLRGLGYLLKE